MEGYLEKWRKKKGYSEKETKRKFSEKKEGYSSE